MACGVSRQLDLLGETFPLRWLPEETVYSLASRYHRIIGAPAAHVAALRLFGSARRDRHDLPVGIDRFVERTSGLLGDAESIIREHTILPYYLPLRPQRDGEDAIRSMRGQSLGTLKYRLGILTSRFGAGHPLKTCPQCAAEDRASYGVAYWHLPHQYPGVWLCLRHNAPLQRFGSPGRLPQRFGWELPVEEATPVIAENRIREDSQVAVVRALAVAAQGLASVPHGFRLEPCHLLATYHAALDREGLRTSRGGLRLREIAAAYGRYCQPLLALPEFEPAPGDPADHAAQIGRLLRQSRGGTHPLRHLALALWLFGDWERFWSAYNDCASRAAAEAVTAPSPVAGHGPPRSAGAWHPAPPAAFLALLEQGTAITTAGRALGVDPSTAMAWAASVGISTRRRPKTISAAAYAALVEALSRGEDKHAIAERFAVSRLTVSRILRREPELLERWSEQRRIALTTAHRARWSELLGQFGHLGVRLVRALDPPVYAWLYRNDRSWLLAQNEVITLPAAGNHSRVNWAKRDNDFLLAVRRVLAELSDSCPPGLITLGQVLHCLPQLAAKLKHLNRMPQTRRALEILLVRRRPRNPATSLPI